METKMNNGNTCLLSYRPTCFCFWMKSEPKSQTKAVTLLCHHTILIFPSIHSYTALTGNSFLRNGSPVLSRAMETKKGSFQPRDNHRLHPPLDFAAPYSTWSREMKARCIASGITLGFFVFSTAEKVELQFAMEATKFEALTFEDAILVHMLWRGNWAIFWGGMQMMIQCKM